MPPRDHTAARAHMKPTTQQARQRAARRDKTEADEDTSTNERHAFARTCDDAHAHATTTDDRRWQAGAVRTCAHTNASDTTRPRQPGAATCHTAARSTPPEHKMSASGRRVHTHTHAAIRATEPAHHRKKRRPNERRARRARASARPTCQAPPPRRHVSHHRNEIDDDPTGVTRPRAVQAHTRAPRQTN